MGLADQQCEVCQIGAPRISDDELESLLPDIPSWQLIEVEGVKQLIREFDFPDFKRAQLFTNAVADLAEAHGHHPAILLEWGKVTVRWWTHKIHGLHKSDLVLAAKTDQLER